MMQFLVEKSAVKKQDRNMLSSMMRHQKGVAGENFGKTCSVS